MKNFLESILSAVSAAQPAASYGVFALHLNFAKMERAIYLVETLSQTEAMYG
jgi:hypothetical protein